MSTRVSQDFLFPLRGIEFPSFAIPIFDAIRAMQKFVHTKHSPYVWFGSGAAVFFTFALLLFFLSANFAAAHYTPSSAASALGRSTSNTGILELNIANNGLTLLRNAQVISVNGSTLLVRMKWGFYELRLARTDNH